MLDSGGDLPARSIRSRPGLLVISPVVADGSNTQSMFLRKDKEPHCKHFDDEKWIQHTPGDSATGIGPMDDVPEEAVTGDAPESWSASTKVRPIQMGEFLRQYVSRRLLALNDNGIGRLMIAIRQLGNGGSGGAETLALFHELLFDEWSAGGLSVPLARIKVDENNCFGRIEWRAIRDASRQTVPRHTAVACWKHAAASFVKSRKG